MAARRRSRRIPACHRNAKCTRRSCPLLHFSQRRRGRSQTRARSLHRVGRPLALDLSSADNRSLIAWLENQSAVFRSGPLRRADRGLSCFACASHSRSSSLVVPIPSSRVSASYRALWPLSDRRVSIWLPYTEKASGFTQDLDAKTF